MQYMTSAEIREKYLQFFEEKGCKRMPSSSLIPDDPSLLLTSAGMVQFKPYFLQQKHLEPPYIGTTTVQKCVRTNDIDIIGTTGRHLSFFEMLGNFSFGDYFKKEMCAWAYEFSTEILGLDPDRLYYTVYKDDDETVEVWESLGIDPSHISRLGEEDNFWRAGPTGPCGPCSEIYYDQGPEFGCGKPTCGPGCECDRYLEYWNLVFTQYDGQEDGSFKPLPKKNIDTGMGLERIAAILQGVQSNFETDVLRTLVGLGESLTGKHYGDNEADDRALRIMADHSRAVTFMISDGILPSNEGRGYVLRRLLRRAVMKGHLLGLEKPFLKSYVDEIVRLMGHVYPEIVENKDLACRVILSEEERFGATLRQGRTYLNEALDALHGSVLPGKEAFTLHDTYGFPVEITEELCAERGISVDMDGFEQCMDEQKRRARENAKDVDKAWSTYGGVMSELLEEFGPTTFDGYTKNEEEACVLALLSDGVRVDTLEDGQVGKLILDRTPFYAEKGGQIGDTGTISCDHAVLEVTDTQEPEKGLIAHSVVVKSGSVSKGDIVQAAIDVMRRERIRRNHTATHILHWALRTVLGTHVKQAGSLVAENRLRFDFTHFEAMTDEQIREVEYLCNEKIMENYPVVAHETSLTQAREEGVMALFGEKYGEIVRVLEIGDFSRELCGGTHVSHTSEIGFLKIMSESSVGANVRRIEALTSFDALAYMNRIEDELQESASELRVPLFDVSERVLSNIKALKDIQTQTKKGKEVISADGIGNLLELTEETPAGYPVIIGHEKVGDAGVMRNSWDILRSRMTKPGAVVLAAEKDGKPLLMAAGTPEAVEAGFDASRIIKEISPCIKGGGGGKPTMAQAGGKDIEGIEAALKKAREILLS
ncbi:MAG: alanine--tRNA ligase [Eggerthellaceae bacterium]|jgi:alanyl-tRNA synthetase